VSLVEIEVLARESNEPSPEVLRLEVMVQARTKCVGFTDVDARLGIVFTGRSEQGVDPGTVELLPSPHLWVLRTRNDKRLTAPVRLLDDSEAIRVSVNEEDPDGRPNRLVVICHRSPTSPVVLGDESGSICMVIRA
jgi:hypothetical protein